MDLFLIPLILGLPLAALGAGLFDDFGTPLWMERASEKANLKQLKLLHSDQPAVGYVAVSLKRGIFRDSTKWEDIFGQNDLIAFKSVDDAIKEAGKLYCDFVAEVLLFGKVDESPTSYGSKNHRVLQVASLRMQARNFFLKSRELEDIQPVIDKLQDESGSPQPVRHVPKIEELEPTLIQPSSRALRRAQKVNRYYSPWKAFYAEDDRTVAPGLYPVGAVREIAKRSKRPKSSSLEDLTAALQSRISETSGRRLQKTLRVLLIQLTELSSMATKEETKHSLRLIEAKRITSIQRLLELSSREYYGSFFQSPERWSDPERMALQVELSAIALTRELTEDLRLLNSPRELEFQLSVRSLVGRDTEARSKNSEMKDVGTVLQSAVADVTDLRGDLEDLRAAVAAEENALLGDQSNARRQKIA